MMIKTITKKRNKKKKFYRKTSKKGGTILTESDLSRNSNNNKETDIETKKSFSTRIKDAVKNFFINLRSTYTDSEGDWIKPKRNNISVKDYNDAIETIKNNNNNNEKLTLNGFDKSEHKYKLFGNQIWKLKTNSDTYLGGNKHTRKKKKKMKSK